MGLEIAVEAVADSNVAPLHFVFSIFKKRWRGVTKRANYMEEIFYIKYKLTLHIMMR